MKIEEFKVRNKNNVIQNENNELKDLGKKPVNTFIDELVRLSMEQKCFSEEEMVTEAFTMMAGVSIYQIMMNL